jgi:hypothetical protein
MHWRVLCIAAALILPTGLSAAGDSELDRATLRGLKAVNVVIDHIDPQLPKESVPPADLQARIVDRLKNASIVVDAEGTEFLGLQVAAVRSGGGGGVVGRIGGGTTFALSFTIGLYQAVLLSRDRNVRTVTKTWEVETIMMADPKSLKQAWMDSIDDLAARFIAAYRSVNPSAPKP